MNTLNWLNRSILVRIDPRKVDLQDRTCHFPFYHEDRELLRSVLEIGVINPPVVQDVPGKGYIPVLGRRRLRAAIQAGTGELEARVIPSEIPQEELFRLAFWDNIAHRVFDQALTAVVVRRLLELFPIETAASLFFPALQVPARGPRVKQIAAVGALEDRFLAALARGRITFPTAVIFTRMDPNDRSVLLDLAVRLKLNGNRIAQVAEMLFDLSVLKETTVSDLLASDPARRILESESTGAPEKAEALRRLVREWKFPELAKKEGEFRSWVDSLDMDETLLLKPSRDFEDDSVTLQVRIQSREAAKRVAEAISREMGAVGSQLSPSR